LSSLSVPVLEACLFVGVLVLGGIPLLLVVTLVVGAYPYAHRYLILIDMPVLMGIPVLPTISHAYIQSCGSLTLLDLMVCRDSSLRPAVMPSPRDGKIPPVVPTAECSSSEIHSDAKARRCICLHTARRTVEGRVLFWSPNATSAPQASAILKGWTSWT
jgi:hypothetical protein